MVNTTDAEQVIRSLLNVGSWLTVEQSSSVQYELNVYASQCDVRSRCKDFISTLCDQVNANDCSSVTPRSTRLPPAPTLLHRSQISSDAPVYKMLTMRCQAFGSDGATVCRHIRRVVSDITRAASNCQNVINRRCSTTNRRPLHNFYAQGSCRNFKQATV